MLLDMDSDVQQPQSDFLQRVPCKPTQPQKQPYKCKFTILSDIDDSSHPMYYKQQQQQSPITLYLQALKNKEVGNVKKVGQSKNSNGGEGVKLGGNNKENCQGFRNFKLENKEIQSHRNMNKLDMKKNVNVLYEKTNQNQGFARQKSARQTKMRNPPGIYFFRKRIDLSKDVDILLFQRQLDQLKKQNNLHKNRLQQQEYLFRHQHEKNCSQKGLFGQALGKKKIGVGQNEHSQRR